MYNSVETEYTKCGYKEILIWGYHLCLHCYKLVELKWTLYLFQILTWGVLAYDGIVNFCGRPVFQWNGREGSFTKSYDYSSSIGHMNNGNPLIPQYLLKFGHRSCYPDTTLVSSIIK